MRYSVEMTPTAEAQLMSAFSYIHERAPLNARRWLQEIHHSIDTLEMFPHRCGVAPEAEHLGEPLRHHLFKSHRIISPSMKRRRSFASSTFDTLPRELSGNAKKTTEFWENK